MRRAGVRQARDVHQLFDGRLVADFACGFGDIDRIVADALDVGNHLHNRANHAQVAAHRLLQGNQPQAARFNLHINLVYLIVALEDLLGAFHIVTPKRLHRVRNHAPPRCLPSQAPSSPAPEVPRQTPVSSSSVESIPKVRGFATGERQILYRCVFAPLLLGLEKIMVVRA
jgi:hypothetical protein